VHHPFNLETDVLLRGRLYHNAINNNNKQPLLVVSVHHIAVDLWSLTILMSELGTIYASHVLRQQLLLPPPLYQFVDYARWLAHKTIGVEGEKHWLYWKEQLSGDLPVITLPYDKPRPPAITYNGNTHCVTLSSETGASLKKLSTTHNVTLYATILSVFQTLLYRYTGQGDIMIGTPMSCRTTEEVESIVGYFINPNVIRCQVWMIDLILIYLQPCH